MKKKCSRCGEEKFPEEFYREKRARDGLTSACKKCLQKSQKKYESSHKEQRALYQKKYRAQHKEELKKYQATRYLNNKETYNKKSREYYYEHRDNIIKKVNDYTKKRRRNDPLYAYVRYIRGVTNHAIRSECETSRKAESLLGCTLQEAREYLLSTWLSRYGHAYDGEKYQIDHIIPLFQASTIEEVNFLLHYTNLQMLTPEDNMKKGKSLIR